MKSERPTIGGKAGMPPESLVYTGTRKLEPAEIEILVYDEKSCQRSHTGDPAQMDRLIDLEKVNLLLISNLTDVSLIEKVGSFFEISPLLLEDVLNTSHLPKTEESGEQLLFTLKLLDYSQKGVLLQQHITLMLGDHYVLVFKDFENRIFDDITGRIISGKSRARLKKADYLFYLLTDTLIDSYYGVVNEINNKIDSVEEQLLEAPDRDHIQEIYLIKRPMSDMRGVLYPVREALLNMVQGDFALLEESTLSCMQDVRDHINHIIHMYETGRDTLSDLIELNSSNISNRLNKSMNLLTIITTLFIPLTLIAGIYGMNFKFIPEISWKVGYPFALLLMLITAGIMLFIMKRNKLL
jgi:magnesium transporter